MDMDVIVGFDWDDGNNRKNLLIRVISARDMSRKERLLYEQEENEADS
jgi:uncharacterized DUF497 family protein